MVNCSRITGRIALRWPHIGMHNFPRRLSDRVGRSRGDCCGPCGRTLCPWRPVVPGRVAEAAGVTLAPVLASHWSPTVCGAISGGVVLRELSKLLHQGRALGAPYLRSGLCSPQRPSRSEGVLLKGVIGRFWCHVTVCDRREIMLVGADDFRELVADARRAVRCKAGQRRYIQTAPTYECLLPH